MPSIDHALVGPFFGWVSLLLCLLAFASRRDDRLLVLLLLANVAFTLQFLAFGSWTAAALSALVILRIFLARRYPGSTGVMSALLVASALAAALTWQGWPDLPALIAMIFGTVAMFMFQGIAMRVLLGLAAIAWMLSHILVGSLGGTLAEALVLVTNAVTIWRLYRVDRQGQAAARA